MAPPSEGNENQQEASVQPIFASCSCQKVVVGTSGYSYKFWTKNYYPKGFYTKQWSYYSQDFDAVELNGTFYHFFDSDTWEKWSREADEASVKKGRNFQFIIKANKFYSHTKWLIVDEKFTKSFTRFVGDCRRLGTHLGPILMQFPGRFHCKDKHLDRLRDFGCLVQRLNAQAPEGAPPIRIALEFRHESWYNDPEVFSIAEQFDMCVALLNINNISGWAEGVRTGFTPSIDQYFAKNQCSWGTYVRFHGTTGQYTGAYPNEVLDEVVARCLSVDKGNDYKNYLFFNNTDSCTPLPSAIRDAKHIRDTTLDATGQMVDITFTPVEKKKKKASRPRKKQKKESDASAAAPFPAHSHSTGFELGGGSPAKLSVEELRQKRLAALGGGSGSSAGKDNTVSLLDDSDSDEDEQMDKKPPAKKSKKKEKEVIELD